jgi:(p)ppGpp synthase/HD superfamily hydrolase
MPLVDRTVTTKSRPALPLSFTRDLPLTQAAVEFARERHSGQVRAIDGAPFIAHVIEVAAILERSHYPDHVVAAAVLHDVLEDTWTTREELEELRFGTQVAEIVATLSEIPAKREHYERSLTMLEQVIPSSRIVEVLRFELEELAALPPQPPRQPGSRGGP